MAVTTTDREKAQHAHRSGQTLEKLKGPTCINSHQKRFPGHTGHQILTRKDPKDDRDKGKRCGGSVQAPGDGEKLQSVQVMREREW